MWEFCFPSPTCSGELPLAYESFDKLLQFECKISAPVHFVFYFICTDVALKLQQLFLRVDVKGKVNSLPKSFALHMCFLKPYWQLLAIFIFSSIFDVFFQFSCVFVGRHLDFPVWAAFGRSWSCPGHHLNAFWTLWEALGGPWGALGPLLGRSWTLLGRSWGLLEASCTDFELELEGIRFLGST